MSECSEAPDWKVLYICSSSRCGSTITDMILGSQPGAFSTGELNLIGKSLAVGQPCGCGSSVRDCEIWKAIFHRLKSTHQIDLFEDPYCLRLWDGLARNVIDRNRQTRIREELVRVRRGWAHLRLLRAPWLLDADSKNRS